MRCPESQESTKRSKRKWTNIKSSHGKLKGSGIEVRVTPVVIGALGTIPRGLGRTLGITIKVELIQKVALL